MSEQTPAVDSRVAWDVSRADSTPPSGWIGSLLIAVGVVCVGAGLWRMYHYTSSDGVVGGDAYNYIILGLRGLAWVVAGSAAALLGGACLIVAEVKRGRGR